MLHILKILLQGPQKFLGGHHAAREPKFGHVWYRAYNIKVGHSFKFLALVELGAILLMK
jgi:hypothetical protein